MSEAPTLMESMSGQQVYISLDGSTLYVPIPRPLAADTSHGCGCDYCKAHPDETPKWDALAIAAKAPSRGHFTWTVHFPELRTSKWVTLHGWPLPKNDSKVA
jgi:hypothetical protein